MTECTELVAGELHGAAERTSNPAELQFIYTLLLQTSDQQEAEKALVRFLRVAPSADALAWADLARIQLRKGRANDALNSVNAGFQINRDQMLQRINRDAELRKFVDSMSPKR